MKCQLKYHWVKLPRACLPQGKGVLGQWAKLAARAAYRKGVGRYCGFENPVEFQGEEEPQVRFFAEEDSHASA